MFRTVEHIVRAHLYNPTAAHSNRSGKISRCYRVQQLAQLLVALGLVHCGVCGTVHYSVYLSLLHQLLYRCLVGYIKFGNVCVYPVMFGMFGLQSLHLIP